MRKVLILIGVSIFLSACGSSKEMEYLYEGESEHWEAVFLYKGQQKKKKEDNVTRFETKDDKNLELRYKGKLEDLSSVRNLKYSYETSSSSAEHIEELDEPLKSPTLHLTGMSKGGQLIEKDEVIKVKVKWDDEEETLLLKNTR